VRELTRRKSKSFTHLLVLDSVLGLGEEVSDIVLGTHIGNGGDAQVLLLLGVVILDCDVLGSFVRRFVLGQLDGGLVVLSNESRIGLREANVCHEISEADTLRCGFVESEVFSYCSACSYGHLSLGAPVDQGVFC
jgi:hypothetical protein